MDESPVELSHSSAVRDVSPKPPGGGEAGTLVCADNLTVMRSLPDGCCDLIYVDPPFGSGRRRTSRESARGYDDTLSGDLSEYTAWLGARLAEMRRLLSEKGSLYVHLDWRAAPYARVTLDGIFGSGNFLNEIIWSYRTGGVSKRWFGRKHDTILLYAKRRGRHTFNVQRAGMFRTDGLLFDDDGRPFKKTKKGRLYFHADGPAMGDVWDIPFLSTVSSERTGYPTQKPLALLKRIVAASSDCNDMVADFFCGSGTTLAAAQSMGRRWMGCDIEGEAVRIAGGRLGIEWHAEAL